MFSIILAAGKGTRMGATDRPKVCLDVAGVPVILRALETFACCGVAHHVIVVGDRAEQVAATVCGRFPQTIFAFEHELRGTGHAARCGASVLDAFGYAGDVLVAVGDKLIEEHALREQLDLFRSSRADLCFMVGARDDSPEAGRIVEDEGGGILANVEVGDLARARLIGRWFERSRSRPLDRDAARAEMLEAFLTERKARRAMPPLWRLLDERSTITTADLSSCFSPDEAFFEFDTQNGGVLRLSADELETRARWVNLSVYCFRMEALRYALERLATANAQGEEYLTDAIGTLPAARTADGRPRFRVVPYPIKKATDALAFNTPEELEAIRDYYRGKNA
jgi:bifunctional N-acetylglucosamine-1-phosphate-uridyltransferase/glucosamine-1-phosphate-acetyltransferase GlmU-like protein